MNPPKQYFGKYIAEVVSVEDPEKRCRVKVNVYDLFDGVPAESLPFANFVLPLGSRPNEGAINPVQVGDKVWVEFIGGDSRRPLIIGAAQAAPNGIVNLAPDGRQGVGQFQHKRTEEQPKVEEAPYYQDVVYCQNHTLIQLCRNGTIRVTQMDSGSAIEILSSGDIIVHCEGNMFISVAGNALEEYAGNLEQRIHGNLRQDVHGSIFSTADAVAYYTAKKGLDFKGDARMRDSLTVYNAITGRESLSVAKSIDAGGNVSVSGNISAGGSIMDAAGNSNHHEHPD